MSGLPVISGRQAVTALSRIVTRSRGNVAATLACDTHPMPSACQSLSRTTRNTSPAPFARSLVTLAYPWTSSGRRWPETKFQ